MELSLPARSARYTSASQITKNATEPWAAENLFCPSCPSNRLEPTPANTKVVDFECPRCSLRVQLKASSKRFGRAFTNSAYAPKVEAIKTRRMPDYALLSYDREAWVVRGLEFVPGHFLSLGVIQRRNPLKPTARRSGWVGSKVLLGLLPPDARVGVVQEGKVRARREVREQYARTKPLKARGADTVGWTVDVLREVRELAPATDAVFTLRELYAAAAKTLAGLHPKNRHVEEKMRQQMQVLRDMGIVEFVPGKRGTYRIIR
jgi:type II restriction enzyme